MPQFNFFPALSALATPTRFTPPQPVRRFFRSASYKLRPPSPRPYLCAVTRAQDDMLARGGGEPRQRALLRRERRFGPTPTIMLGGFVPDSTGEVFLLRGFLLRQGCVYYLNYPPTRTAFESVLPAFFPRGKLRVITAKPGETLVQHASLIFHYFQFLPPIADFYRRLKLGKTRLAA